ncbi:MFS transporter [Hippea maritima]|uniref:Major facilitator superfamily MFS_1 n=1 Tax=Hippea maritima (strain ATCC 700847 / DSM 10411 / MH2) TaxID=760142 RepID=F2LXH5_HIPMA|nr:MFS transporter [Hippea maritima]AEA33161.1 major facilitator superfamily MFS_1 [Hippea maritima DSM 10411]
MKNIDKNVVLLGWVSYFTDMASAMINPVLPVFVVYTLHEGVDKLGIIVAVSTFVSYALRFVSGYISDRLNITKPLVVGGYLVSAISKPLIGSAYNYIEIALLKAVERVGKAMRSAPKDSMIAFYSKKKRSGKTFGFHKTMDIAGELSGTILLFALLYHFGQNETIIRNIFHATLIPGFVGVAIVALFVKNVKRAKKKSAAHFELTYKDKATVKILFFYFIFIFFIFNEAFFTMQAKGVGIATTFIPLLFIVSTTTQTATSYLSGILIDKIGTKKMMLVAYASGIFAQFLLYIQKPVFTWIAYIFLGLFTVISLNANRALIADSSDNKGSIYGIFYAGVAVFGASGAYICGTIWKHIGVSAALEFSLAGCISITVFYVLYAADFLSSD